MPASSRRLIVSSRRAASIVTLKRAGAAGSALAVGALCACGGSDPTPSRSSSGAPGIHREAASYNGRTSCRSLVYIGESTSVGMVTPAQIPAVGERLEARMKSVGVESMRVNVSGGRSAIERLLGRPNTVDVLTPSLTKSFTGCYFLALGVNDAANSSFPHSAGTARQRIETVLARIGNHPVIWPLVATDPGLSGPYSNANMRTFDEELTKAAGHHPNLRLYDWPAEMSPSWREGDGIHDNRIGSRERALMYARALTVAFPQKLPTNTSRVVGSLWGKKPMRSNAPSLPPVEGDHNSFWASDTKAVTLYTSGPEHP